MNDTDLKNEMSLSKVVQNDLCDNHIGMTLKHLIMKSPWALQMLDSSSKFPSGLLEGNVVDLGNYDECIKISVNEEWGSFRGQHCVLSTKINDQTFKNIPLIWSICIPSTCNAGDLTGYFNSQFDTGIINVRPETCSVEEIKPFLTADWIAILIFCCFGLLCTLSTVYDLLTEPGKAIPVLLAFSWYTNGKQLFNINNDNKNSENIIQCIYGLKFLCAVMIVFGHTYYIGIRLPTVNMKVFRTALSDWGHFPLCISALTVDTFLVLTGLLLYWLFAKSMEKGTKFNIFLFYIVRYLRLTPILAIAILVRTGLLVHMGSGPIWNIVMEKEQMYCEKNWWKTLLYIQNYVDYQKRCGEETWYLAADMQLYILSPLFLIPLVKRPWIGFGILQLAVAISILTCFLPIYFNSSITQILDGGKIVIDEYMFTHTRATSWLMGLSLGFILHKTQTWQEKSRANGLSKTYVIIGWLVIAICFILPIVWGHKYGQPDYVYDALDFSIGYTFARFIWCLGLVLLIFACVSGFGGPVNAILSWKIFQPLSRLSYSIYLIHVPLLLGMNIAMRTPRYFSDLIEVQNFLGTLVLACLLSIPAYLMFESPTDCIMKALLKGKKKPVKNQIYPDVDLSALKMNQFSYQRKNP